MTIRAFTDQLAAALAAIYPIAEAGAIAALLTEHLLHLDPLQRRMQAAAPVPPAAEAQAAAWLPRLLAHEPVQYVLGTAHFAGLELEVSPATLIPRPETEELLRLALREVPAGPGQRLLDVGTGSGALACALAQARPEAEVWAVDVSGAALAVARHNAARYGLAVLFQELDILRELPTGIAPQSLTALVSNPPYVRESEQAQMRPNVLAWEPALALFVPDADPLLFYRRLGEIGRELLVPGGHIFLEINEMLSQETLALLRAQGYADVRGQADMFGKPRFVTARAQ